MRLYHIVLADNHNVVMTKTPATHKECVTMLSKLTKPSRFILIECKQTGN